LCCKREEQKVLQLLRKILLSAVSIRATGYRGKSRGANDNNILEFVASSPDIQKFGKCVREAGVKAE
jgi:hypothetical protein